MAKTGQYEKSNKNLNKSTNTKSSVNKGRNKKVNNDNKPKYTNNPHDKKARNNLSAMTSQNNPSTRKKKNVADDANRKHKSSKTTESLSHNPMNAKKLDDKEFSVKDMEYSTIDTERDISKTVEEITSDNCNRTRQKSTQGQNSKRATSSGNHKHASENRHTSGQQQKRKSSGSPNRTTNGKNDSSRSRRKKKLTEDEEFEQVFNELCMKQNDKDATRAALICLLMIGIIAGLYAVASCLYPPIGPKAIAEWLMFQFLGLPVGEGILYNIMQGMMKAVGYIAELFL